MLGVNIKIFAISQIEIFIKCIKKKCFGDIADLYNLNLRILLFLD